MADAARRLKVMGPVIASVRFREWVTLSGLVVLAMFLRFWRLGDSALLGDESYYWLWSRHLALCYLDNPAGVAWQTWLGTLVGGQSEFGVRWLNALLGVGSVVWMYGLVRRLFSAQAALLAAAFLAVSAPYLVVSRFVYTDALPIFLLLLNLNQMAVFFRPGPLPDAPLSRWLSIGLVWMLLLNTKLSVYPYGLGLALGILLWRRELLRQKHFWLAVAMAAVGTLPWIVWNATHAWAGLRWMWQHTAQGTVLAGGPLSMAYHVVTYLSPGLVLFVLTGFFLWRVREGRWLILLALPQLLPVALSPANSPRNLLVGCLPLLAAGAAWFTSFGSRRPSRRLPAAVALWLLAALVGLGTTVALVEETPLPHSTVVRSIRQERAGVRALGAALSTTDGLILTIDYNLASQLSYYSGRGVYTTWEQYLIWGLPGFDSATVLSLGYVSNELVSASMAKAFQSWDGPTLIDMSQDGIDRYSVSRSPGKWAYLWHGRGLQVPKAQWVRGLDLFALAGAPAPGMP